MTIDALDSMMPGASRQRMTAEQRAWLAERLGGVRIGIAGATGAVGREALALLAEAGIPPDRVTASGSVGSAGVTIPYADDTLAVVSAEQLAGSHAVLLATPASVSAELAPSLAGQGALVSDNSSALRARVPLVIPEINSSRIKASARIVASPNCTTTIALTAAEGIRTRFGISSIEIVSYQAISGAGAKAMHALISESADVVAGTTVEARWLAEPVAFNVFPHESEIDSTTGLCAEERKFIDESARILGRQDLNAAATCVRVPTLRAHSVVLRIETARPCTRGSVVEALQSSAGVALVHPGPTSLSATGHCTIQAGRPIVTPSIHTDGSTVRMLVAGDQLLKGAAWNALQNLAHLIALSAK